MTLGKMSSHFRLEMFYLSLFGMKSVCFFTTLWEVTGHPSGKHFQLCMNDPSVKLMGILRDKFTVSISEIRGFRPPNPRISVNS